MNESPEEADEAARGPEHDAASRREANLDGTLHVEGECCGRGSILGGSCRVVGCGGRVHGQAIYGGILEICEICEADRLAWHPRGTFLTENTVLGVGTEGSEVLGEVGGAREILPLLEKSLRPLRYRDSGASEEVLAQIRGWLAEHASDPGAHAAERVLRFAADYRQTRETHLRLGLGRLPAPAPAIPAPFPTAAAEVDARGISPDLPSREEHERAIARLRLASTQLAPDGKPCVLCGDSAHQAFECRLNPVVAVREAERLRVLVRELQERLRAVPGGGY